jgi:hypothetical protein
MSRAKSGGTPVPREFVFVLTDGTYCVQWHDERVQELVSGRLREFSEREYGHRLVDREFEQLREAGIVVDYDSKYVWLSHISSARELGGPEEAEERGQWAIVLGIPDSLQDKIARTLAQDEPDLEGVVYAVGDGLVLAGPDGQPFASRQEAEAVLERLRARPLFEDAELVSTEEWT